MNLTILNKQDKIDYNTIINCNNISTKDITDINTVILNKQDKIDYNTDLVCNTIKTKEINNVVDLINSKQDKIDYNTIINCNTINTKEINDLNITILNKQDKINNTTNIICNNISTKEINDLNFTLKQKINIITNPKNNYFVYQDSNGNVKNSNIKLINDMTNINNLTIPSSQAIKNYIDTKIENINQSIVIQGLYYFLTSDKSNIDNHNILSLNPDINLETKYSVDINNEVKFIKSYISPMLNTTNIPSGVFSFYLYGSSSNIESNNYFIVKIYKYNIDNEILLLTCNTNNISSTNNNLIICSGTLNSPIICTKYDRLIYKIYGYSNSNTILTLYNSGFNSNSYSITPFISNIKNTINDDIKYYINLYKNNYDIIYPKDDLIFDPIILNNNFISNYGFNNNIFISPIDGVYIINLIIEFKHTDDDIIIKLINDDIFNENNIYEYTVPYENYKLTKRFISINLTLNINKDKILYFKLISNNILTINKIKLSINLI